MVGVVKSVLTTVIGFFTFGGVPITFLTLPGIFLNTFGGILYSYAKYMEKKAALQSVHNVTIQLSEDEHTTKENSVQDITFGYDVEKGKKDADMSLHGSDERTFA